MLNKNSKYHKGYPLFSYHLINSFLKIFFKRFLIEFLALWQKYALLRNFYLMIPKTWELKNVNISEKIDSLLRFRCEFFWSFTLVCYFFNLFFPLNLTRLVFSIAICTFLHTTFFRNLRSEKSRDHLLNQNLKFNNKNKKS